MILFKIINNLITSIKNEYGEKKRSYSLKKNSESDLSKNNYNTFRERDVTNHDVQVTVETLESNSNYDYELGATETKNLWRKHLVENSLHTNKENRFKKIQKQPFNANLSKIENELADEDNESPKVYHSIRLPIFDICYYSVLISTI